MVHVMITDTYAVAQLSPTRLLVLLGEREKKEKGKDLPQEFNTQHGRAVTTLDGVSLA